MLTFLLFTQLPLNQTLNSRSPGRKEAWLYPIETGRSGLISLSTFQATLSPANHLSSEGWSHNSHSSFPRIWS